MTTTLPIQIVINQESRRHLPGCLESMQGQTFLRAGGTLHILLLKYEPIDYEDEIQSLQDRLTRDHLKISLRTRIAPAGFGANHNFLRRIACDSPELSSSPAFLILNPDTILDRHCIEELWNHFQHTDQKAGLVEARQFPLEHPKDYDLSTCETNWCSCACVLVQAAAFKELGGFDEVYHMYMEDVDLSWRMWLLGKPCHYCPPAVCGHSTGLFWSTPVSWKTEDAWKLRNHLILAWKFFGQRKRDWNRYSNQFRRCHLPEEMLLQAWNQFTEIRDTIAPLEAKHARILIRGVGRYHDLRF